MWMVAADLAVGLAFLGAGAIPAGPFRQRLWIAAIGAAWLLGTLAPQANLLHQGLLIVALQTFPTGHLRGRAAWFLTVAAVVVTTGLVPQLGVAALFVLVVVTTGGRLYPSLSAVATAGALTVSWLVPRFPSLLGPELALLIYQLVLLLIAASFPLAARSVVQERRRLADRVLSDRAPQGLAAIAAVLADALDDPDLRVWSWPEAPEEEALSNRRRLRVNDDGVPVAVIDHDAAVLQDPPTARAAEAAVRLAAVNLRLRDLQIVRLRDLEAARARVVAAADDQRAAVAAELRNHLMALLTDARIELAGARRLGLAGDAEAAVAMVESSLATAAEEIDALVVGIPPARLGDGLLGPALLALTQRIPAEVALQYDAEAAADPALEAALYYVCSEALANVVKHAGVGRATITIQRQDGAVSAVIADDGRGGADPAGSGLTGLRDRLAAYDGRLRVDSPPGAGTTLTATVPLSRSSATV
ncbi:hypothetical protein E0H75_24005 [Kribbella capetownensis]|uniref:histidine kinase n=1 Tax=Kribbella capetownensis TaxID=1572659 RepID=A0A4R0JKY4_9ACTN|nr:sensor histidine kinase [Kribbella capetownensis]TCC47813.1 hypothetical protein E0H75_24005 [Kribbella capetownensis]